MPVEHSPIANEPQNEGFHGFERPTPSRIAASFRAALSGGRTSNQNTPVPVPTAPILTPSGSNRSINQSPGQGQTRATGETFLERAKRAVRRDYRQFAGLQRGKPAKAAQKVPKVVAPGKRERDQFVHQFHF